ncbi:hypothetical protein MRX96_049320 [Rhipicephalus microplus]
MRCATRTSIPSWVAWRTRRSRRSCGRCAREVRSPTCWPSEDIRLDWTFRLSLLNDLVKGMRYLHNSPIRQHGHLTSRNCVIDSRWVLKVTDYGMPAFQDLQAIATLVRSAKDLLWTAPELLRGDCSLLRRGTQSGDVYSFAIVMQEVLLRGDPYCMLPLTAEGESAPPCLSGQASLDRVDRFVRVCCRAPLPRAMCPGPASELGYQINRTLRELQCPGERLDKRARPSGSP